MTTPITQLNNQSITDAEFVKLTVSFTTDVAPIPSEPIQRSFYFSTSYQQETINGEVYSDLGGLVGISSYQRDLSSTGYDTTVALTGIDQRYIYIVAGSPATEPFACPNGQQPIPINYYPLILGSEITIFRGFYVNYTMVNPVQRYKGIVTGYSINENRDQSWSALENTYTVALRCSAYKKVLENRIAGRRTNTQSWKNPIYGATAMLDTSMDRVAGIENKQFDFGKSV